SSAGLKGRDGPSRAKPPPSGPSAAVGGPQRADGSVRGGENAGGTAAAAEAGGSTNAKGENPSGGAENGGAHGSQAPLGTAAGRGGAPRPTSAAAAVAAAPLAGGILEDRRRSIEGRVPSHLPGRTKSAGRGLTGSRSAGGDERAGAAADAGVFTGSEGLRSAGRDG
ncbi:unnamed protein product, partial [Scytosiphon promiscuus]